MYFKNKKVGPSP